MSKSTKKTLIISGIIMLAWILVIFFVCKANACDCPNYSFHACNNTSDKTGVNTYPILIYPEVSILDLLYRGDIEETNRAWQRMNEFLYHDKKLGNAIESKITVDKPCECIKRIEELERKVEALNKAKTGVDMKVMMPKVSGAINIKALACVYCEKIGQLHFLETTHFWCMYCGRSSLVHEYFKGNN